MYEDIGCLKTHNVVLRYDDIVLGLAVDHDGAGVKMGETALVVAL